MSVVTKDTIQPSSGQALTIKDEGGTASITIQTDGDLTLAENAYLGSSKGIYFDGGSASANFLDDYEEGTFTPTLLTGGSASSTLGTVSGSYTKIGNFVHVSVQIPITSGGGSGDITVGGLPFTSISTSGYISSAPVITSKIDCSQQMPYVAELSNNSTTLQMRSVRNSQASSHVKMQISNIGNSSQLQFSLTYLT